MKVDENSNSTQNRCMLQRSLGKSYTLLIPTSKRDSKKAESNHIVERLAQQFDNVYATPMEHCSTARQSDCKAGIRAEALRRDHKEGSEKDYLDAAFVLNIVHGDLPKNDRVRLLDINGLTVYSMKCKSNLDSKMES